jgi:hypothetical protein
MEYGSINRTGILDQGTAAYQISQQYGDGYVYINKSGNLAIAAPVLKEFHKLTGDNYIWERGSRMWRSRHQYDKPGRQQD